MVTTKCCIAILIGVLVAVGVAVGIYFATETYGSKPPDEVKTNPFENLNVAVKTKHSIIGYNLINNEYHETAKVDASPYGIISFGYYNNRTIFYAITEPKSPMYSAFPVQHPLLASYTDDWIKTAMTVDQLTGNIYVADRIRGEIHVIDALRGHHKKLITDLDEPLEIVLYHAQRRMYILTKSSILSATMNGRNVKVLIQTNKSDLRAIAMDFTNERLYYAVGNGIVIYDLKTSQAKVAYIWGGPVASLTVLDQKVLVIPNEYRNIFRCAPTTGNSFKCEEYPPPYGVKDIRSIQAYGHLATMEGATSPCDNDNGGCQHLCLLTPSEEGYVCDCDDGLTLNPDKKNCMQA